MILVRRLLCFALAELGIVVWFALLERALAATGVIDLLGIRPERFVAGALLLSCIGSFMTWFLARDIAVNSLNLKDYEEDPSGAAPSTQVPPAPKEANPAIPARATVGLAQAVDRLAAAAGLSLPPTLRLYANDEINAFTIARTRAKGLIAISRGLLLQDDADVVDTVIAQQLVRLARGDITTQLLLQGTVHIFTLFPTRVFALVLGTSLRTPEDDTPTDSTEAILVSLLELLLTPLTSLLIRALARSSEAAADRKAGALIGAQRQRAAFAKLAQQAATRKPYREWFVDSFKFLEVVRPGWTVLSFHQPLRERVRRLALD